MKNNLISGLIITFTILLTSCGSANVNNALTNSSSENSNNPYAELDEDAEVLFSFKEVIDKGHKEYSTGSFFVDYGTVAKADETTTDDQQEVISETIEDDDTPLSSEIPENIYEEPIDRFIGDWNGTVLFTGCSEAYKDLEKESIGCTARFALSDDSGIITPSIILNTTDIPFTNLEAVFDPEYEIILLSGEWDGISFNEIPMTEKDGTLSMTLPLRGESGETINMFLNSFSGSRK